MANISNPLPFITKREYGILPNFKNQLFQKRLDVAKNLYRKDLICHYGCVNAIEFSNNGEMLVSGGDDRRVMVWSVARAAGDVDSPTAMRAQHQSNIFCLALTHDHATIYSGGNDDIVIVHDVSSGAPREVLRADGAVCGLAADPRDARRLATAGSDGRLLLFDTRRSVHGSGVVGAGGGAGGPWHGVSWSPRAPLLAAANARTGAALYDLRHHTAPVMRYVSSMGSREAVMSVTWDGAGRRLLALRRRRPPALYAAHAPRPMAECAHPDYYNSCTMKSGCFAGDDDDIVLSGSDDFHLYAWRVPDLNYDNEALGEPRHVEPALVLTGHRSIVNQVRYNTHYGLLASAGVEKIIKLWSTWQWPGMRGELLAEREVEPPRELYSHEDYVALVHHSAHGQYLSHNYTSQSTTEDPRMMAFFDNLVARELECAHHSTTDSPSPSATDSDVNAAPASHVRVLRTGRTARTARRPPPHKRTRCEAGRVYVKSRAHQHRSHGHRVRKRVRMSTTAAGSAVGPARAGATSLSGKGKRPGRGLPRLPRPRPRPYRAPARAPPPPMSSERTDSDDAALHVPPPPLDLSARSRRGRRGALCCGLKRKPKSTARQQQQLHCFRRLNLQREESTARNDLPTTSTGYRGAHTVTSLFCISEADSETERDVSSPRPIPTLTPVPALVLAPAPPTHSRNSWVSLRLSLVETNDSERESSASTSDQPRRTSTSTDQQRLFKHRVKKPRRNYRPRRTSDSN